MPTGARKRKHRKRNANQPLRVGESILKTGRSVGSGTKDLLGKINSLFSKDSVGRLPRFKKLTFPFFIGALLALLAVIVFVANNQSIVVDRVTVSIPGLPADLEGYKILVLSDLQGETFGEGQSTLLRVINGLSYNMVLFTGDMVGTSGNPQPFYELLEGMTANRRTYFIAGDSDPGPLQDEPRDLESGTLEEFVLADWILGAQERGAVYVDKPISFTVRDATVWLTPAYMLSVNASDEIAKLKLEYNTEAEMIIDGDEEMKKLYPFTAYRYSRMQALYDALARMGENDLHLSLSHIPVTLEYIATAQANSAVTRENRPSFLRMVDLVLAGHYCGGVWKLPFIGALYIPDESAARYGWLPDQSQVQGLTAMNSAYQYVSAGLGCTNAVKVPPVRLFNNSQVTVLTLTATLTELK